MMSIETLEYSHESATMNGKIMLITMFVISISCLEGTSYLSFPLPLAAAHSTLRTSVCARERRSFAG
jgi:hypothetical protein